MSTATIFKVLGFLPVDQFVAIITVVAMILEKEEQMQEQRLREKM